MPPTESMRVRKGETEDEIERDYSMFIISADDVGLGGGRWEGNGVGDDVADSDESENWVRDESMCLSGDFDR